MKTLLAAAALLSLMACTVTANPLIKEKARNVTNQPRPAQPAPPPAQQRPPAAPGAAAAATPATEPQVRKIVADLAVIKSRPEATPELKKRLAENLMGCIQGSARPSEASVNKLADTLAGSLAGKKLTGTDQSQLAYNLGQILNGRLTSGQLQIVLGETRQLLQGAGFSTDENQAIMTDLRAVATEVQDAAKGQKK